MQHLVHQWLHQFLHQSHHDVIGSASFSLLPFRLISYSVYSKTFGSCDWCSLLSWFASPCNRFDDCVITHSDLHWKTQYHNRSTNSERVSSISFWTTTSGWWLKRRPKINSSRIRKFRIIICVRDRYFPFQVQNSLNNEPGARGATVEVASAAGSASAVSSTSCISLINFSCPLVILRQILCDEC